MLQYHQKGESAILACSALKQDYRDVLAGGFAKNEMRFVYLHAPIAVIQKRMKSRRHPYMNPGLLASQLATLEIPTPSDAWSIDVAGGSPVEVAGEILARLREAGMLTSGAEK